MLWLLLYCVYHISCLQHSMEEFVRNNEIPVSRKSLDNYWLSKYKLSFILLKRQISDRLLDLDKDKQSRFCSKCHFFILV